jgi:hypothetical protein
MTNETNVSEFIQFRISSSVQSVKVSRSITCARRFAIINCDDFIVYTSRDRRYVLNFFKKVIFANLKFSSIHSANFVWNESQRSSSSSSSHSCILFSSMWSLDSYFFFDLSSECSTLFVDFSLLRIETRLRLANDDSKVICRFAEIDARFLSTCRDECWLVEVNAK